MKILLSFVSLGSPHGMGVKHPPAIARDARDLGSITGSGRFPGVGNGNPLRYPSLEGLVGYSPWGHKESDMTEWLTLSLSLYMCLTLFKALSIPLWTEQSPCPQRAYTWVKGDSTQNKQIQCVDGDEYSEETWNGIKRSRMEWWCGILFQDEQVREDLNEGVGREPSKQLGKSNPGGGSSKYKGPGAQKNKPGLWSQKDPF